MKPFFSIIMPVYNSERYLKRAIVGIIEQAFADFELIIVDDGSQDSSLEICREFAAEDPRVVVIQANDNAFGVSGARNAGLKKARGAYIAFVDSDDAVEKDLLEKAHACLSDGKADLLKYSCVEEYYDADGNLAYPRIRTMPDEFVEEAGLSDKAVEMECIPLFGYVWNGVYKRQIIVDNGIEFNTAYKVNEDFDFNIQYLKCCSNMQCLSDCLYHYAKRGNDSLSSKQNSAYYDLHMMKIRSFVDLHDSVDSIKAETRRRIFWLYARFVYSTLQRGQGDKGQMLQEIKRDKLFEMFRQTRFRGAAPLKQVLLTELLKSSDLLPLCMVSLIDFVRNRFPVLFAKWKE